MSTLPWPRPTSSTSPWSAWSIRTASPTAWITPSPATTMPSALSDCTPLRRPTPSFKDTTSGRETLATGGDEEFVEVEEEPVKVKVVSKKKMTADAVVVGRVPSRKAFPATGRTRRRAVPGQPAPSRRPSVPCAQRRPSRRPRRARNPRTPKAGNHPRRAPPLRFIYL